MKKRFIIFIIITLLISPLFSQDLNEYIDLLHPNAFIIQREDSIIIEMQDIDMREFLSISTILRIYLSGNSQKKDVFIIVNGEMFKLSEIVLYGNQLQSSNEIQRQYFEEIRPIQGQSNGSILQD